MNGLKEFRYPFLILILLLLDVTLVIWSCSERSRVDLQDPTVPPEQTQDAGEVEGYLPILATSIDQGHVITGTGIWGIYEVYMDSSTKDGDITPLRQTATLGDPHEVDITAFMRSNPCRDCFTLRSIEYTEDEVLRGIFRVRHPFDPPEHNPPLMNERLDLHVFDLAAIIITPDGAEGLTDYSSMSSYVSIGGISTLTLDNSGFWASESWDGFTTDFDSAIDKFYPTTATLHPYKILSLDTTRGNVNALSANGFNDVRNPSGHNVFAQGSEFESALEFKTPPGRSINLLIALTASYGQSAAGKGNLPGQRCNPRYFIPEFNRKDAWRAKITIPEETDLLASEDMGSKTLLVAEVWDWQQNYGYPMDDIDPLTSRLDALRAPSHVASCVVDIPGVNDLDVISIPVDGSGFNDTPLVYRIVVQNDKNAGEGNYFGLLGVIDDMHGTMVEDYGIERDGITTFDVADFVTYVPFDVDVIDRGAESFGMNQSMTGFGDDLGYVSIIPDANDGHNLASYYYNVYAVYSAYNALIGNAWDVYFQKSTNLGDEWDDAVRLNTDIYGTQRFCTIKVNMANGDIYVAYVDFSGLLPEAEGKDIVLVKSTDGGKSFSEPVIINSSRTGHQDQVTLGVDPRGTVYAAWRSQPGDGKSYIYWAVSYDGINFSDNKPMLADLKVLNDIPVSDPVLTVDYGIQSDNYGAVYLVFRRLTPYLPDIMFSRYVGGSGFEYGACVSNESDGQSTHPSMAVNNKGVIFVAYIDESIEPPGVRVARSFDSGKIWAHTQPLNHLIDGQEPGPPILIVRTNNNFLYLLWHDLVNDDRNIYAVRSTNGLTYCKPIMINNDDTLTDQEFPKSAVNQYGNLFAVWRDKRLKDIGEMFFTRADS